MNVYFIVLCETRVIPVKAIVRSKNNKKIDKTEEKYLIDRMKKEIIETTPLGKKVISLAQVDVIGFF